MTSHIAYRGRFSIACPSGCGELLEGSVPLPDYDVTSSDVHSSEDEFSCFTCNRDFTVTVDHAGAELTVRTPDSPATTGIVELQVFDLDFDLVDIEPPRNAFEIFHDSIADIKELRDVVGAGAIRSLTFHRMVFMQHFAAIEAYLSDTLLGLVYDDDEVVRRLVREVAELKSEKITLEEALDPKLVRNRVLAHLGDVSFHNFRTVDSLYQRAIGHKVLPVAEAQREVLFKALRTRHDCVHRNGYSREGQEHRDLENQVRQIESLFVSVVSRVQDAVEDWNREPAIDDDDFVF